MKMRLYILLIGLVFSAVLLATTRRVHAVLGASVDSVESDRKTLSAGRHKIAVRNGYTVHEIGSASTIVREYASPSGVVFGIAWNGLIHPELDQLLGSYFADYKEALRHTPRIKGHRRLRVKASGVVVEKWGHMRNLQGRAYAPALIPPGVSVDEIR